MALILEYNEPKLSVEKTTSASGNSRSICSNPTRNMDEGSAMAILVMALRF